MDMNLPVLGMSLVPAVDEHCPYLVSSPDPLYDAIGGGAGGGGDTKTTGEGLANRVHLPRAEAQIPCKVLVCNLARSLTAPIQSTVPRGGDGDAKTVFFGVREGIS